jgi:hypothetical protein
MTLAARAVATLSSDLILSPDDFMSLSLLAVRLPTEPCR